MLVTTADVRQVAIPDDQMGCSAASKSVGSSVTHIQTIVGYVMCAALVDQFQATTRGAS